MIACLIKCIFYFIDWWNDWVKWLTDWSIDWLTNWLIDRLIVWLIDWLIDDWLINRLQGLSVQIPAQSRAMLDSVVGLRRNRTDARSYSVMTGGILSGIAPRTFHSTGPVRRERSFIKSLMVYLMEQSYIGTLIVMMVSFSLPRWEFLSSFSFGGSLHAWFINALILVMVGFPLWACYCCYHYCNHHDGGFSLGQKMLSSWWSWVFPWEKF